MDAVKQSAPPAMLLLMQLKFSHHPITDCHYLHTLITLLALIEPKLIKMHIITVLHTLLTLSLVKLSKFGRAAL